MCVDETSVLGRDDDVCVDHHVQPAPGHRTVDGCDDGLPHTVLAGRPEHLLVEGLVRGYGAGFRRDADVLTGAEVPVAGACHDRHADVTVAADVLPDRADDGNHAGVPRVPAVRTVQGDDRDMIPLLVDHTLERTDHVDLEPLLWRHRGSS
jgi:hypothetical protein